MSSLGEKLRQAREANNLDIRDVADSTRISVNYLRAIEQDDYRTLPGGIFNKGFVRSFAKAVGMDEKEALADYTALIAEQAANAPAEVKDTQPRYKPFPVESQSSRLPTILFALLFLGLLVAGIYFGFNYLRNNPISMSQLITPSISPSPEPTNAPLVQNTPDPLANGLKVQLSTVSQKINIEVTADGERKGAFDLLPGASAKEFSAQQSLKLRYAKTRAGDLRMTLNDRPATLPIVPANPKMNGIDVEITRENFTQYLQQ